MPSSSWMPSRGEAVNEEKGSLTVAELLSEIRALTFDVFGTVVDWYSSIIREGEAIGRAKGLAVDWARFADAWREGYAPAMDRVRHDELPWTKLDDLHRLILDGLLAEFHIQGL